MSHGGPGADAQNLARSGGGGYFPLNAVQSFDPAPQLAESPVEGRDHAPASHPRTRQLTDHYNISWAFLSSIFDAPITAEFVCVISHIFCLIF